MADEVKKMENEHVICGYRAFVNWDKTYDEKISARIEIKVMPRKENGYDKIAEKIYRCPEVETLYLMSASYDFIVILKKAPRRHIANFVASKPAVIEEVQGTTMHIVLDHYDCYKDHDVSLTKSSEDMRRVVLP